MHEELKEQVQMYTSCVLQNEHVWDAVKRYETTGGCVGGRNPRAHLFCITLPWRLCIPMFLYKFQMRREAERHDLILAVFS